MFQAFLDLINAHGTDAWRQLQREHRRRYGENDLDRRERYHAILREQVRRKRNIGIPIEAPGRTAP